MLFLSIKSACFLLIIITIAFSSSRGVVEAGFNIPSGTRGAFNGAGNKIIPAGALEKAANLYKYKNGVNQGFINLGEQKLKALGEHMAEQVFGPAGRKGFSWGWNGSKYYLKAAKSCAKYKQLLTSSCIQPPHSLPSLKPNCIAACVIEFTQVSKDGTPKTCTWHDDDSCYYNTIQTKCKGALTPKDCKFV